VVGVPFSVTVTGTPETGLLAASRTWTTTGRVIAAPDAVLLGWAVKVSVFAAPFVTAKLLLGCEVSPAPVAVRV